MISIISFIFGLGLGFFIAAALYISSEAEVKKNVLTSSNLLPRPGEPDFEGYRKPF